MSVFVSADDLRQRIQTGRKYTILASLWEPQEGKALSKYFSEHIPTSQFCDPAAQLAGMPGSRVGRNPLPKPEVAEHAIHSWGIEDGRPVFIYDQGIGLYAARAWWILRWMGVEDVHIVDGGFAAWDRNGFDSLAGPGSPVVKRSKAVQPGNLPTASMQEVRAFEGLLIDARGADRFDGRREILDLRAGHIPGAINLPVYDLFDKESQTLLPEDQIRDRFAQVGLTQNTDPAQVIAYSGSGNHSALLLAVMEHVGLPVVTHYVGGWSQWSANKTNPVATDL
ncbi:sulfurtransferase [Corynebacterium gottingense]|uniref:sulfurtransferase n=1 Tax=Corynebacterium gottingense TaxID=2041036 RepID=UPI0038D0B042